MPPPGPVSTPTVQAPPCAHANATVVEVVGVTVVEVVGVTVVEVVGITVVEVVVVVVATAVTRVIVFLNVLATYLPDLAIFKVNAHEPVAPILRVVGFFDGLKVHEPLLDHVFTPGEFVETRVDNFTTSPLVKDETFHVTVVGDAAATEPPADNATTTIATAMLARPRRFITLPTGLYEPNTDV
jgi:hypothetical protein